MTEQFKRSQVFKDINDKEYFFYMRTLEQAGEDYRTKDFTADRFKYAFLLEDMAGLVSSDNIASFLRHHASLFRDNKHGTITNEDLGMLKKFIAEAYESYKSINYISLGSINDRRFDELLP